tara:strand:+ start:4 stop:261 length:258 start_codon:yes stop_codon:yes gene_type:complete
MALLMKANGTEETIHPQDGSAFTLEELHRLVGGYIERVPTHLPKDFIVNEEGRLKGLPANQKATMVVGQSVVGDMVILTGKERLK